MHISTKVKACTNQVAYVRCAAANYAAIAQTKIRSLRNASTIRLSESLTGEPFGGHRSNSVLKYPP